MKTFFLVLLVGLLTGVGFSFYAGKTTSLVGQCYYFDGGIVGLVTKDSWGELTLSGYMYDYDKHEFFLWTEGEAPKHHSKTWMLIDCPFEVK